MQGTIPGQFSFPTRSSRVAGVDPLTLLVEGLRVAISNAVPGKGDAKILRVHFYPGRTIVLHDEGDAAAGRGAHGEAAVLLLKKAFRAFAQRFDHQSSIFIEYPVGAAVLGEGIVQAGREPVEFEQKGPRKLLALGG